jgi:hypothetical protein
MFASKNCPNDSKAGCKGSSSLVKFVETNVNFEKKSSKFLRSKKLWICESLKKKT